MKKNKKILIIVIAIIILLIIGIVAIVIINNVNKSGEAGDKYTETLEDGSKVNTSSKLEEIKNLNGLEFTDIDLISKDDVTIISSIVTNTTEETITNTEVKFVLIDESGNDVTEINATISEIEAGASTEIGAAINGDYASTYDVRVELVD